MEIKGIHIVDLKEDSKYELKKPMRCENNKYRLNVKATKNFSI